MELPQARKEFLAKIQASGLNLDQYLHCRKTAFHKKATSRVRIYLDTKYWIYLRDALKGSPQKPLHTDILNLIFELHGSGIIQLPVSDVNIMEVSNQSDISGRSSIGSLMDRLSNGLALLPYRERVSYEISVTASDDYIIEGCLPFVRNHAWVSPIEAFVPDLTEFHEKNKLPDSYKISYLEMVSETTVKAILEKEDQPGFDFEESAKCMQSDSKLNEKDITSFDEAFEIEFIGSLSEFREDIAKHMNKKFSDEVVLKLKSVQKGNKSIKRARHFPTTYIFSILHASVRWDKQRLLSANDIVDIYHASAAIPYYDAFFTENALAALSLTPKFKFVPIFGCKIMSKESDILDYLNSLRPIPL